MVNIYSKSIFQGFSNKHEIEYFQHEKHEIESWNPVYIYIFFRSQSSESQLGINYHSKQVTSNNISISNPHFIGFRRTGDLSLLHSPYRAEALICVMDWNTGYLFVCLKNLHVFRQSELWSTGIILHTRTVWQSVHSEKYFLIWIHIFREI